jgi:anti-anti-sigma factor
MGGSCERRFRRAPADALQEPARAIGSGHGCPGERSRHGMCSSDGLCDHPMPGQHSWPERFTCCDLRRPARCAVGARSQAAQGPGASAVEIHCHGSAVIVVLTGEFDLAMAPVARQVLTRAISDWGELLVIDLSGLTFIDSSGLHVILDTYRLCREKGQALTVRTGPPNVQQVFALARLLDYLPFELGG